METAMLEMADCQQHGPTAGADKTARDLRMYALLCRRIREDNYSEMAGYQPRLPDDEMRRVFERARELVKQDEEALATMFRHLRCWWN